MEQYFKALQNQKVCYREIAEFMPDGEWTGIRAITYDATKLKGQKTKVFAYLGFPQDATEKVPAIVLVHGGGGVVYLPWVKMWNDRGYAAIAMSTTGDFPIAKNAGRKECHEQKEMWNHGLCGVFCEDGYTDAPDNDSMCHSECPLEENWMYHAVSQVILAHNILRQDERIDSDRIGITGISWGGVITSLTIGYDNRFAFAIPIYGSGYLAESMGTLGKSFRSGKNPEIWLAEKQFSNVTMPVLWLCWNHDAPFSLNSNSKSYLDTVKNNPLTRFSAVHEMNHSHECGWIREENFVYADSIVKNGKHLPDFVKNGKAFTLNNPDDVPIKRFKLYYLTEKMSYREVEEGVEMEQEWNILPVEIADYQIPENAVEYYLEAIVEIEGKEYVVTSSFEVASC